MIDDREKIESYIKIIREGNVDFRLLDTAILSRHKYYRIPDTTILSREQVAKICKGKIVLDFGCRGDIQYSDFHHYLGIYAGELWGVDKHDSPNCKNFIKLDVEYQHFTSDMMNKHWDYLVLGDFIEHLLRPADFLENCRMYLDFDNMIIITPNAFSGNVFSYTLYGIEMGNIDHYCIWSPRTLKTFVTACGYKQHTFFYIHEPLMGASTEAIWNASAIGMIVKPEKDKDDI